MKHTPVNQERQNHQNRQDRPGCRYRRGMAVLMTAAMMSVTFSGTALADTQTAVETSSDGTAITTVEYANLSSLIQNGNSTIRQITDSTEESRKDYTEFRNYLIDEKGSINLYKKEAQKNGEAEETAEYAQLEAVYQAAVKSLRKSLERLDSKSTNQTRINQENQLTATAQNLMVSWQTLSDQEEYLKTAQELYQAQYETAIDSQTAGLNTQGDLEKASQNLESATGSLESIQTSMVSLKQSLCSLLGLDSQNTIFAQIPEMDSARIQQMDLETDTKTALEYNTSMISARDEKTGGSTVGIQKKERTMAELESQIRIQMQQLYENVKQSQTAYEAAQAGYEAAQITWNSAQSQYKLGMTSKVQYLQSKMIFQQKKASWNAASLSLLQAVETYDWAVKGQLTIES